MEITNHTYQNRHITLVKGLVTQQAFSSIRQSLTSAPPDSSRQLWIDCSHVDRNHLSSSSLCSFVNELLKIKNEQVQIVFCGMDKSTERLFVLLKLDMLFLKAHTWQEAHPGAKQEAVAA